MLIQLSDWGGNCPHCSPPGYVPELILPSFAESFRHRSNWSITSIPKISFSAVNPLIAI